MNKEGNYVIRDTRILFFNVKQDTWGFGFTLTSCVRVYSNQKLSIPSKSIKVIWAVSRQKVAETLTSGTGDCQELF